MPSADLPEEMDLIRHRIDALIHGMLERAANRQYSEEQLQRALTKVIGRAAKVPPMNPRKPITFDRLFGFENNARAYLRRTKPGSPQRMAKLNPIRPRHLICIGKTLTSLGIWASPPAFTGTDPSTWLPFLNQAWVAVTGLPLPDATSSEEPPSEKADARAASPPPAATIKAGAGATPATNTQFAEDRDAADPQAALRTLQPAHKPSNIPFLSLGALFKGREAALNDLHAALNAPTDSVTSSVTARVLTGTGGIGKSRLAIEYALRHEADYSALLFVRADSPEALAASFSRLVEADVLDLPDQRISAIEPRCIAVRRWLATNPGWLMIIDNVDDPEALAAVVSLLAQLRQGKVIVTGRISQYPAGIKKAPLGEIDTDYAVGFLLERTRDDRAPQADDSALAGSLVHELGGLPLGLEQAAAYIAASHISIGHYLRLWMEQRAKVVNWFDKTLMSYNHDTGLAATWMTSILRLTPYSRHVLERLAYVGAEPVPETLFDIDECSQEFEADLRQALSELCLYSLVSPISPTGVKGATARFVMHRLVQDFAQRSIAEERKDWAIEEARRWLEAAASDEVRIGWNWKNPLARDRYFSPHLCAIAAAQIGRALDKFPQGSVPHIKVVLDAHRHLEPIPALSVLSATLAAARQAGTDRNEIALLLASYGSLSPLYLPNAEVEGFGELIEAAELFSSRHDYLNFYSTIDLMVRRHNNVIDRQGGENFRSRLFRLQEFATVNALGRPAAYLELILSYNKRLVAPHQFREAIRLLTRHNEGYLCVQFLLMRLSCALKHPSEFGARWNDICTFLEDPSLQLLFAIRCRPVAEAHPKLFAQPFAKLRVEQICELLAERKAKLDERQALLAWRNVLSRILAMELAESGNDFRSKELLEIGDLSTDADLFKNRLDRLRAILDLVPTQVFAQEIHNLVVDSNTAYGTPCVTSFMALRLYAEKLASGDHREECTQVLYRAFNEIAKFAIAMNHIALREIEELFSEVGERNASLVDIDCAGGSAFLGKTVDPVLFKSASISLVVNERKRVCMLFDGTLDPVPKFISYNRRYFTFHFKDGSYFIVDHLTSDYLDKLIRQCAKLFLIRLYQGMPLEAFDTEIVFDSWPE